jgi:hypothetical protein
MRRMLYPFGMFKMKKMDEVRDSRIGATSPNDRHSNLLRRGDTCGAWQARLSDGAGANATVYATESNRCMSRVAVFWHAEVDILDDDTLATP